MLACLANEVGRWSDSGDRRDTAVDTALAALAPLLSTQYAGAHSNTSFDSIGYETVVSYLFL